MHADDIVLLATAAAAVAAAAAAGFWVPGGGVDPGEGLVEGAVRECREEAGVDVVITGILDLESHHGGTWRRVIFLAEPAAGAAATLQPCSLPSESYLEQQQKKKGLDPLSRSSSSSEWRSRLGTGSCCSPKTLPDWESGGACWVAADELRQLPLRSASEPCRWFQTNGVEGLKGQLPLIDSLELPREWAEDVFEGFPCQRSSGS
jgi:ADP-ribose pyrophosphatase YjhB (NUDIX family)